VAKTILRKFIDGQIRWSQRLDRAVPRWLSRDGNSHFVREMAWQHIGAGQTVYDIGGGKHPLIPARVKEERRLRVIGVDIDAGELRQAPPGAYDDIICADICSHVGAGDGDLLICQALLEHVPDTQAAFRAMASMLRPGGKALLFVPSRNALFARLNLLLPEELKKKILYSVFPQTAKQQGFKSYYDACTPRGFRALAARSGFEVRETQLFYQSAYFTFFFPLHALWRCWVLLFHLVDRVQSAETFAMVLEKRPQA
jgi:2-polyprenyl-6-hydroxyphenyl methylase/3-demethylubiquinone-9 3-methyltransferase